MASVASQDVRRVVYFQLVEGDFRKFQATSNDAPSGGGARDLRFRPFERFRQILGHLFPGVRTKMRRRGGTQQAVAVQVGRFHWLEGNQTNSMEVVFEPPTDVREDEGRLTKVHLLPPFNRATWVAGGRMLLLMVQQADDTVWPVFVTEQELRSGDWSDDVSQPILMALDAPRRAGTRARGFIDLAGGGDSWHA